MSTTIPRASFNYIRFLKILRLKLANTSALQIYLCCAAYAVGCEAYAVGCAPYSVGWVAYAVGCAAYSVDWAAYAVGCAAYSVGWATYADGWAAYSVRARKWVFWIFETFFFIYFKICKESMEESTMRRNLN